MENTPHISDALKKEIALFFGYVPPARLSRNLRDMLLDYLYLTHGSSNLGNECLLQDIQLLLQLLDIAADELPHSDLFNMN